jgi:hypothetical protein
MRTYNPENNQSQPQTKVGRYIEDQEFSAQRKCTCRLACAKRKEFVMGTILIIVLVLLLLGTIPSWPHSRNWGYGPSGGLGLILIIVVVLLVLGYLPRGF